MQNGNYSLTPEEQAKVIDEEKKRLAKQEIKKKVRSEAKTSTGFDQDSDPQILAWNVAKNLLSENKFVTVGTKSPTIYRYTEGEGIYRDNGEDYIVRKIQENLDQATVSSHLVHEIIGHVSRSTRESYDIFEESNPHLVLQNSLFNLETMQPEPFTYEYHALASMPVIYNPQIDYHSSLFWKFLNEILESKDVLGVQEEIGQILAKDYRTKKFSIYHGEPNTGKTTLLNVIIALLGSKNVSSLSLQQIASKDRFNNASLFGKMANIRDDMPKDVIQSVGALKEITGRSRIPAEYKFKDMFEFVNHAYLISSVNDLPPLEDDDNGFFDRVKLRPFKRKYGGHAKPDRELEKKLTTPEELSAVLNFGLEGLARLKQNDWNFSHEDNEIATREFYKRKSDPIWGFAEDCVDSDSEGFEIKEDLFNVFRKYCQDNDLPNITRENFYRHFPDKVRVTTEHKRIDGKPRWVYSGIKLRLDSEKGVSAVSAVSGTLDIQNDTSDTGDTGKSLSKTCFEKLDDPYRSKCAYCGEDSVLEYRDQDGNHACKGCKERDSA